MSNKLYAVLVPRLFYVNDDVSDLQASQKEFDIKNQMIQFFLSNGLDYTVYPVSGTWRGNVEQSNKFLICTDEVMIREFAKLVKDLFEQESVMYWVESDEVHFV